MPESIDVVEERVVRAVRAALGEDVAITTGPRIYRGNRIERMFRTDELAKFAEEYCRLKAQEAGR